MVERARAKARASGLDERVTAERVDARGARRVVRAAHGDAALRRGVSRTSPRSTASRTTRPSHGASRASSRRGRASLLVVFGPASPAEVAVLLLARGRFRAAFRRFSRRPAPARVGGASVHRHVPRAARLRRRVRAVVHAPEDDGHRRLRPAELGRAVGLVRPRRRRRRRGARPRPCPPSRPSRGPRPPRLHAHVRARGPAERARRAAAGPAPTRACAGPRGAAREETPSSSPCRGSRPARSPPSGASARARSTRSSGASWLHSSASAGGRSHVLDLGAGNGWLSARLAERGHRCVAADLRVDDVDGLAAAAPFARRLPRMFGRVAASFDALPLRARLFDLVVFDASLHLAEDLARVLAEAARAAAPGGRVAVLDSPFYARADSGEAMRAEKRRGDRRALRRRRRRPPRALARRVPDDGAPRGGGRARGSRLPAPARPLPRRVRGAGRRRTPQGSARPVALRPLGRARRRRRRVILLLNTRATKAKNRRFPLSVLALAAALPDGVTWEIVDGNLEGSDPAAEAAAIVAARAGTADPVRADRHDRHAGPAAPLRRPRRARAEGPLSGISRSCGAATSRASTPRRSSARRTSTTSCAVRASGRSSSCSASSKGASTRRPSRGSAGRAAGRRA